jgi:hypothetical protein
VVDRRQQRRVLCLLHGFWADANCWATWHVTGHASSFSPSVQLLNNREAHLARRVSLCDLCTGPYSPVCIVLIVTCLFIYLTRSIKQVKLFNYSSLILYELWSLLTMSKVVYHYVKFMLCRNMQGRSHTISPPKPKGSPKKKKKKSKKKMKKYNFYPYSLKNL